MNKIVIDGKEIELSDGVVIHIYHALYDYPSYTDSKMDNFKDECKRSSDIREAIEGYSWDKKMSDK